jgi:hypothetical protein
MVALGGVAISYEQATPVQGAAFDTLVSGVEGVRCLGCRVSGSGSRC